MGHREYIGSFPAIVILLLTLSALVTVIQLPDSTSAASEPPMSMTVITSKNNSVNSLDHASERAPLSPEAETAIVKMIQVGYGPYAVAFNPVTSMLYVANYADDNVTVINGTSNRPVANITVGDGPDAIAVDPSSDTIYVANSWDNDVTVVDGRTLTNITSIAVGNMPDAIAIDPSTGSIYVANGVDNTVSVINNVTKALSGGFPVGDFPYAMTISPSSGRIWVADYDDNNVTIVNRSGFSEIANVTVGSSPNAAAVDPLSGNIYVADYDDNNVTVINGTTDKIVANITVGDGPDAIAVDPSSDTIYVANSLDNDMTVIDGRTLTNITSIAVGNMPDAIAIDPSTGSIYVANYNDNTVSVIARERISQPIQLAVAGSGPSATVTLSGCSVSPTSVIANGVTQAVQATPSCVITATLPPSTSNTRYVGSGGNSSLSIETCSPSGECQTRSVTIYCQHHVSVEATPSEGGSVSPTSGWFNSTAQLDLSAKASKGWQFEGWTGTGSGSYSGTQLNHAVTASGPVNETALFYPGLTIMVSGSGSVQYSFGTTQGTVQSNGNQTVYAPKGSTIVLTANPSSLLYSFVGWNGVLSGGTSQRQTVLTVHAVVGASFNYNLATIGGMTAVVAIVAAASVLLVRRRKQVATRVER